MLRLRSAVLALPVLVGGCFSLPAKAVREDSETYALAPDGRLDLSSFNGRIEVRPNDEPGVRIRRTTTCRAWSLERAEGGLLLAVPTVESREGRLTFKVSDPSTFGRHYQVDLIAWAPENANLILRTSNGPITIEGIGGDLDAHTSNGKITARDSGRTEVSLGSSNGPIVAERLSGAVKARTSNGRIELRQCPGRIEASTSNGAVEIDAGRGVDPGGIAVQSSNGRVRCLLPSAFSGQVDARTSNGSVRCEFPIEVQQGGTGKSRLHGRIGGGGPLVRISTSNGPVEIHRSGDRPREPSPAEESTVEGTRKV